MSINSVGGTNAAVYAYQNQSCAKEAAQETTAATNDKKGNEDTLVKSQDYKPDMDKIREMKSDLSNNVQAFRMMVQGLMQKQAGKAQEFGGMKELSDIMKNVDEATSSEAQEAISEDGYWGAKKTAERILEFAKNLSGGDPSKIEMLRNAVDAGFGSAEKAWGGKLPGLCYETYDLVMAGFDDWAKASQSSEESTVN